MLLFLVFSGAKHRRLTWILQVCVVMPIMMQQPHVVSGLALKRLQISASTLKVCTGDKGGHHKNSDKGLLSPLHDICLGYRESLSYINLHSSAECFKMANAYYHINLECIQRKHPSFTATQVECSPHLMYKKCSQMCITTFCNRPLATRVNVEHTS